MYINKQTWENSLAHIIEYFDLFLDNIMAGFIASSSSDKLSSLFAHLHTMF